METARKVAANTAIQVAGRIVGLILTLITLNYISTYLVVDGSALKGFGQYTIVFTYISIIGSAADFGLFTFLVREISGKNNLEAGKLLGNALAFRLILFLVTLLIFILLYRLLPYVPVVSQGIIVGVVVAFSMLFSQIIATIFQAKLLTGRTVIAETLGKLSITIGTVIALTMGYGLLTVVAINLAGQLLILLISYLLARKLVTIKLEFDGKLWKILLPQFISIALINLLALVHFKTDILLLTFLQSEADVGIYGAAYKLVEVVLIIPSIIATNLLPVLSVIMQANRMEDASLIINKTLSVLSVIAGYLIVTLVSFAPMSVIFVTQIDFLQSALPLKILMVSAFFVFATTLLSQAVIAKRGQKSLVSGYLLVIVINVALNLIIIPRYSYVGAAYVTVLTEFILLAYTLFVCNKYFKNYINWLVLARVVFAVVVSGLIIHLLPLSSISPQTFSDLSKAKQVLALVASFLVSGSVFFPAMVIGFRGSLKQTLDLFRVR